jgi:hypothetical protein
MYTRGAPQVSLTIDKISRPARLNRVTTQSTNAIILPAIPPLQILIAPLGFSLLFTNFCVTSDLRPSSA